MSSATVWAIMSHPKIPERPHQVARTTSHSSAQDASNDASMTSRKQPTEPPSKGTGIINFGAFFREHLENSFDSDSGFRKYLTKSDGSHDKEIDLAKKAVELGIKYFLVAYSTLNSDCRTCLVPTSAISEVQVTLC